MQKAYARDGMINIIEETIKPISVNTNAVLFGGESTIKSQMYQKAAQEQKINLHVPNPTQQEQINEAIFSHIFTGNLDAAKQIFLTIADEINECTHIICACTDIGLALGNDERYTIVNSAHSAFYNIPRRIQGIKK